MRQKNIERGREHTETMQQRTNTFQTLFVSNMTGFQTHTQLPTDISIIRSIPLSEEVDFLDNYPQQQSTFSRTFEILFISYSVDVLLHSPPHPYYIPSPQ
jgi:folate-dependent tRNA-U54 methylase TrmFO/GidA